jgi:hypothetical protein
VTQGRQLSRPEVGGGTRLHANQAGRQAPEEADELTPAELTADQNLSILINAMDLEDVLGEIETYCRDMHWSGSLSGAEAITLPEGHCRGQALSTPFMEPDNVSFERIRKMNFRPAAMPVYRDSLTAL